MTVRRQYPAASPTSRPVKTIKKTAMAVAIKHHINGAGAVDSHGVEACDVLMGAEDVSALEKSDLALLKFWFIGLGYTIL